MPSRLSIGQRVKLSDTFTDPDGLTVALNVQANGMTIDFSCFGIDAAGKLSDDRYMIFYNQTSSPENALQVREITSSGAIFSLRLNKLPATIEKLVFTAAIDGNGTMNALGDSSLLIKGKPDETLDFDFSGRLFQQEKALIIGELYRKEGIWRFAAVGQGCNGGLAALLTLFGGEEQPETGVPSSSSTPAATPSPVAAATVPPKISLEKIQKEAPHLVTLAKKVTVSLEKAGLANHTAKVALCLDISGSMHTLYTNGQVQALADRVLAVATRFDDDGEVDVFLFGKNGYHPDPLKLAGSRDYIRKIMNSHTLEHGTRYGKAMTLIREFYFGGSKERNTPLKKSVPVYVMFITDGAPTDGDASVKQLQASSFEPVFWQFMAIGKSSKDVNAKKKGALQTPGKEFEFLEKLDELEGRYIDNANFFSIDNPGAIDDEMLYDQMMAEYPQWLKLAKEKGLLG